MQCRSQLQGFSLTEVLVASAIFVTVMAGVMALYQGAIETTLQGRQAIAEFEKSRAALNLMENDLKLAFTNREHGDAYQFYGRPEGFMFVGTLTNGELGRVTYAMHPDYERDQFGGYLFDSGGSPVPRHFAAQLIEPLSGVVENVRRHAAFAYLDAGYDSDAADAAAADAEATLKQAYSTVGDPNAPTEFNVDVKTQTLIRLEETIPDLETYRLPYGLTFPAMDPEPRVSVGIGPGGSDDIAIGGEITGLNELLYGWYRTALDPQGLGTPGDIRSLMRDVLFNESGYLYALNGPIVQSLLDAKKREIWLRMVSQDPLLSAFGLPGYFVANDGFPNPQTPARRPLALDYTVIEGLVASVDLLASDGTPLTIAGPAGPLRLNALKNANSPFGYRVTSEGESRSYFNDLMNLPGYAEFARNPSTATVVDFDASLESNYGGIPKEKDAGTPVAPRLPSVVQVGFWLYSEKPTQGSADFRRWFSLQIDVPAAVSRTAPTRLTPNSDQSAP